MEIERLRRKRQKNVQEQNLLTEHDIRRTAMHWRENALPEALQNYGETRGIVWKQSILLQLDLGCPWLPSILGLLLTQNEQFIEFEMDADPDSAEGLKVYLWSNVGSEQNLSRHNKGFGMGFGALALKILHELNGLA